MRSFASLFVLCAVFVPTSAWADGLDYSYLDAGATRLDPSQGPNGNGYQVAASYALGPNTHLLGDYGHDGLGAGLDVNRVEAGIGYNVRILSACFNTTDCPAAGASGLDLVADVAYLHSSADLDGSGSSASGYALRLGLRGAPSWNPAVEFDGGWHYQHAGQVESAGYATVLYRFSSHWAAGIGLESSNDFTLWDARLRFNF